MTTCTVFIPHRNTKHYLDACIREVRRRVHPEIDQHIVIADQSDDGSFAKIQDQYSSSQDITLIKTPVLGCGYGFDVAVRQMDTEYVTAIHCDAFPVHHNWLYLPIKLIERYGYSFVGHDSGLGQASAYENREFFSVINNYYRTCRVKLARELSHAVGFIRPQLRHRAEIPYEKKAWPKQYADNGVVAHWWANRQGYGPKLSLKATRRLGQTEAEWGKAPFGNVIDDMLLHLVFASKPLERYGENYRVLADQLKREIDVNELMKATQPVKRSRSVDRLPIPPEVEAYIEELKTACP